MQVLLVRCGADGSCWAAGATVCLCQQYQRYRGPLAPGLHTPALLYAIVYPDMPWLTPPAAHPASPRPALQVSMYKVYMEGPHTVKVVQPGSSSSSERKAIMQQWMDSRGLALPPWPAVRWNEELQADVLQLQQIGEVLEGQVGGGQGWWGPCCSAGGVPPCYWGCTPC